MSYSLGKDAVASLKSMKNPSAKRLVEEHKKQITKPKENKPVGYKLGTVAGRLNKLFGGK